VVIPNATSLQDRTTLLGIIFAEKGVRPNFHLDGMGIMLKGKEEQIRRSKRRSKLRVYFP
jgi:hypothetical protein